MRLILTGEPGGRSTQELRIGGLVLPLSKRNVVELLFGSDVDVVFDGDSQVPEDDATAFDEGTDDHAPRAVAAATGEPLGTRRTQQATADEVVYQFVASGVTRAADIAQRLGVGRSSVLDRLRRLKAAGRVSGGTGRTVQYAIVGDRPPPRTADYERDPLGRRIRSNMRAGIALRERAIAVLRERGAATPSELAAVLGATKHQVVTALRGFIEKTDPSNSLSAWVLKGATEAEKIALDPNHRILATIARHGPITPRDLSSLVQIPCPQLYPRLGRLKEQGYLSMSGWATTAKWSIASPPAKRPAPEELPTLGRPPGSPVMTAILAALDGAAPMTKAEIVAKLPEWSRNRIGGALVRAKKRGELHMEGAGHASRWSSPGPAVKRVSGRHK